MCHQFIVRITGSCFAYGPLARIVADALGAALPQFLSFLAKLIGLDKLGNFVKKIWDALKAKIQKLIDKAIAKIQSKQRKPPKKRCKKCEKQGPGKKRPPTKAKGGSSISACGQCFRMGTLAWLTWSGFGEMGREPGWWNGRRLLTWLGGEEGYADSMMVKDSDIDPATWRNVWMVREEADGYRIMAILLRSEEWMEEHGISKVGDWCTLKMPEQGVSDRFQVMMIGPCPVIESGSGRICITDEKRGRSSFLDRDPGTD
jgi:hypothetical protein